MTSSDLRALCVILPSRRSPSRGDDGASPSRLALESKHRQISFDNGRMATALEPEVRKFTIAEYYKLAEAGVLAPSERVELLNGRIIRMAPIGPRHATIVDKLTGLFVLAEKKRYRTGPGRPVRITNMPARAHKYTRETRTHGVIAPRAFPDAAIDLSDLF